MPDTLDAFRADYNIDTPENVTFTYELAGVGSRFIGALLDCLLLGTVLMLLNILAFTVLGMTGDLQRYLLGRDLTDAAGSLVLAVTVLVNFILLWGYFLLFELLWNGQTPGKRVAHTAVVRLDGNPAGFLEIAVRNLVRLVDFLPWGYGLGLITMLLNSQARRLGDFAAGTIVVKRRRDVTLAALGALALPQDAAGQPAADPRAAPEFPPEPLPDNTAEWEDGAPAAGNFYLTARRLGQAEYQLVREALARDEQGALDEEVLRQLAAVVAGKVDAAAPQSTAACREFLGDVVRSYARR